MPRSIRIILGLALLLVLPVAGLVTSGHVHGRWGAPATAGGVSVCACQEAGSGRDQDCEADEGTDRKLCPICELAKSLQATGLPALLVLSAPSPMGFAPPEPEPCACLIAFIHPASRSPPDHPASA